MSLRRIDQMRLSLLRRRLRRGRPLPRLGRLALVGLDKIAATVRGRT
jgi:hypothetical protein